MIDLVIAAVLGFFVSSLTDYFIYRKNKNALKQNDYLLELNTKQNDEIKYLKSVVESYQNIGSEDVSDD